MIFSMYTWGLVGFAFLVVAAVAEITPNGVSLLQGVGTFWVTVFSSAAFVIPRLLQVRRDDSVRKSTGQGRVSVSGFDASRGGQPVSIMRPSSRRSPAGSSVEEGGQEGENGASDGVLLDEERSPGIPVSRRSVTFDDEASVE